MAKVLITGANGYIGTRLLSLIGEQGHEIVALVRSKSRFTIPNHLKTRIKVIVGDLLNRESLEAIPSDIDFAYYLVHSMGQQSTGFMQMEETSAKNFVDAISMTQCKQIIYLSGLSYGKKLSEHMTSRHRVEDVLRSGDIPLTIFRAAIIIGSGSASFEIIRDLVEKLPIMIAPKWVASRCEPIAIADVLFYLTKALGNRDCYNYQFEIGGPEAITYHDMMLRFAKLRGLRRLIIPVPVLTPRLSSYWLIFVTTTSFPLAQALVDSLKHDAVRRDHSVDKVIPHDCLTYEEALQRAFVKIEQHAVVSSWKDAMVKSRLKPNLQEYISIPVHGCLREVVECAYKDREQSIEKLWQIGGDNGWYFMNSLWVIRGWVDKLVGGVGLRRGRTNPTTLRNGDALDFWRVLKADKKNGNLMLYAEMKVPGDAWLEYEFLDGKVRQTATFRPKGLLGRIYWYLLYPIHYFIFRGLCRSIAK